jgi:hypothetical protein
MFEALGLPITVRVVCMYRRINNAAREPSPAEITRRCELLDMQLSVSTLITAHYSRRDWSNLAQLDTAPKRLSTGLCLVYKSLMRTLIRTFVLSVVQSLICKSNDDRTRS